MDLPRHLENNRREKTVVKKALDSKSPSLKESAVAQYREKDKHAKTSARRDKRQYVDSIATESKADTERKDMMTVYQITRKLRGDGGHSQDLTVKAKSRSTITEEKAKPESWREHFQQLLHRCDPPTFADISEAEQDLDNELGPITVQEDKDAIKKLNNGKAPEDDNVYAEMLKTEELEMPQILQHIL